MESGICGRSGAQNAQEKAFYGGAFIVISMGFYIAWSAYLGIFPNQWYSVGLTSGEILHAMMSWHISFIIGAVAALFLMDKFPKNMIYYGSAGVVIVSGVLMVPSWSDIAAIIAARYIGGLAHGVCFLVTLIHASEVAVSRLRGRALTAISCYLAMSLFASYFLLGLFTYVDYEFYADQLQGILTVAYGIISIMSTRLFYIESPIYLLKQNEAATALNTLAKLRQDSRDSVSVSTEFGELQALVNEEQNESISLFEQANLKPLLRATLIRALYAISTSVAFNFYAYVFLAIDLAQYGLSVVHGARFFGEIAAMLLVDRIGRRLMLAVSLASSGLLLIIIGAVLFGEVSHTLIITCGVLFIVFSLSYGFGLAPVSVVYMGESFTLKKKPYSIALILCIEQLVHIITYIIIQNITIDGNALFLCVGVLLIGAAALCYLITPETKQMSLKECSDRLK